MTAHGFIHLKEGSAAGVGPIVSGSPKFAGVIRSALRQ